MAGRRPLQAALFAVLVVGSLGAILFVFSVLGGPGGAFETREVRPQPVAHQPPVAEIRPSVPTAEPPPARITPQEQEKPEDESAARDRHTPPAVDPLERAVLTLELLIPAEDPERMITVRVQDGQGEPIEGALVVFRDSAGALIYRERADASGEAGFLPYEWERGSVRVDAVAFGYLPATAPAVAPGAMTELTLPARPILEGVVKSPSKGRGVVKLFLEDRVLQTKVESDGSFYFDEPLEEGQVTVQAEVDPYGAASETFFLEGGQRRFVRLRVRKRKWMRIWGRIQFWPGSGRAWINGVPVAVSSGADGGIYKFKKAVAGGLNEIVIDAPKKALLKERFFVKGLATSRYDFKLRREATIRGRVRDERRRPVADAEVRLGVDLNDARNDRVRLFPVERVPVVRTDRDGAFEIARLDKRLIYMVSAVARGHGQALQDAVPDGGFLRLTVPEGPFLFGKLRGLGGVPRDAVVSARRLRDKPEGTMWNVRDYDGARSGRDRKGFYGLSGLLPGTYLVRVDASDYGSVETVIDLPDTGRVRVDMRLRRGRNLVDEDAELLARLPPVIQVDPEDLPPDGTTQLQIDTRRPDYEEPFAGVRVLFFEDDEEIAPPMEFDEPEFELLGLPEGTYRAILTHSALKKPVIVDGFILRRGQPHTLEVR